MNIQELQTRISNRIKEIDEFKTLPIFEEDKGNVLDNIKQAISKTNFCIVVGMMNFRDEAPDSSVCYGTSEITISIFENPLLNRRIKGRPTYLVAAQKIAKELKLFETGDGTLTSPIISPPTDGGNGIIGAVVRFTVKITL